MAEVLFPGTGPVTPLRDLLAQRRGPVRQPFDPAVIDFLDGLSRRLFAIARSEPALAPLAFFVRRSNVTRLVEGMKRRLPDGAIAVPQGTVFHIPPTNVDTLFLYTLAISLLAGNANILRISPNAGPATDRILRLLIDSLTDAPEVADGVTIVRFGRDDDVLAACTSVADVRMIWGGDAAIRAIRRSPLEPGAKELTFPDRVSIAAVSASSWQRASDDERRALAAGLYNDIYWFDQMACSSPVQMLLVGDRDEQHRVEAEIAAELDAVAAERYETVEGQAVNKMVALVAGMERGISDFSWLSNALVTATAADLATAVEFRPGGGFLSVQWMSSLHEVIPQLTRRVQTLSVFGFAQSALVDFAREANGRGVDRIVPVGEALDFDAVWDGKDLLAEALRLVMVS